MVQLLQINGTGRLNAVGQQDQRAGPALRDVGQVLSVVQRDLAAENFAEELHDLIAAELEVRGVEVRYFLAHGHHRQHADLRAGAAAEDYVAALRQPVEPPLDRLSGLFSCRIQIVEVVDHEQILFLRLTAGLHHQLRGLLRRRWPPVFERLHQLPAEAGERLLAGRHEVAEEGTQFAVALVEAVPAGRCVACLYKVLKERRLAVSGRRADDGDTVLRRLTERLDEPLSAHYRLAPLRRLHLRYERDFQRIALGRSRLARIARCRAPRHRPPLPRLPFFCHPDPGPGA